MEGKILVMSRLRNGNELHLFGGHRMLKNENLELQDDGSLTVTYKCLNFSEDCEVMHLADGLFVIDVYPLDVILSHSYVSIKKLDQYLTWRENARALMESEEKEDEENNPFQHLAQINKMQSLVEMNKFLEKDDEEEEPKLEN